MGSDGETARAARGWRSRLISKGSLKRLGVLLVLVLVAVTVAYWVMIRMPGRSFRGPLPAASGRARGLAAELERDVRRLAGQTGSRSLFYSKELAKAAVFIDEELAAAGYSERKQYPVDRGSPAPNFEVEMRGSSLPSEIVVVGAHYDAFQGTPGADDNASGVAAALALARAGAGKAQARTVRFVFFVNEEPPTFQTGQMGSWMYAKACRARSDNIVAMLSLETIGYYSTVEGSQKYPPPMGMLYPSTGDFVAFVGNVSSRKLVRRCVGLFRERAQFPSEGAALPEGIPGVGWSDHWAFWQEGYPAIMVTDTAPFRNPGYHNVADRPETLDYDRMSRVVEGLEHVLAELADGK